jgi:hypothetical protein
MSGGRNVKAGLAMLALSLVGGLAMSLYAFVPMIPVPASLEHYDDLSRRLFRLAHIAAVMLPLLNVVFGLVIDRLRIPAALKEFTSLVLVAGGIGLPLSLAAEGMWTSVREWHLAGPPAVAFTLGAVLVAVGALRTPTDRLLGRDTPSV